MGNAQEVFRRRYNAEPFEITNRHDALAEKSRQIITGAMLEALEDIDARNGEDINAVVAGLLVGLVGGASCFMPSSEHASLRAALIQLIPWAVDLNRSMTDLPPLPEA